MNQCCVMFYNFIIIFPNKPEPFPFSVAPTSASDPHLQHRRRLWGTTQVHTNSSYKVGTRLRAFVLNRRKIPERKAHFAAALAARVLNRA